MISFQKKIQAVLLVFPDVELITNNNISSGNTLGAGARAGAGTKIVRNYILLFGAIFMFLSGCTAQQVGQVLNKISDTNGYQNPGESNSHNEPGVSTAVPATPKIIFFKADPPFAMDGASTTLQWRTDDVTSAEIIGIGTVSTTGSREVTPNGQKKYELVATNSIGQTVKDEIILPIVVPMMGEAPEGFKTRGITNYNKLNPQKTIKITPQVLNKIKINRNTGPVIVNRIPPPVVHDQRILIPGRLTCAGFVQGKIAWDYQGNKKWSASNLDRLCKGAVSSAEPGNCIQRVMHGGINWGGGTKWQLNNALNLCEGSTNANKTISCFQQNIRNRRSWQQAINSCSK